MIRRALLAVAVFAFTGDATWAQTPLAVWVDVDGTAYLWNTTDAPLSFDGYFFDSETNRLDPAGFQSISDRLPEQTLEVIAALGAGALLFGEASPGAGNLAEFSVASAATLAPHAKWSIGKPFLDPSNPGATADFFYKLPSESSYRPGTIVIPEPSTFVLAVLAGIGLLGSRRGARRRSAGAQQ